MNLLDKINTIMSSDLITVESDDRLTRIETIFNENRIHHLPVMSSNKLVGMISKSDYLFFRRGFNNDKVNKMIDRIRLDKHFAHEIMTKGLATMEKDQNILVALKIFNENLFHAIPVMDGQRLVGIVSTYDILNTLSKEY